MNHLWKSICIAACLFSTALAFAQEEEDVLRLGDKATHFCVHKEMHDEHVRHHIAPSGRCPGDGHMEVELRYKGSDFINPAEAKPAITKLIVTVHGAGSAPAPVFNAISAQVADSPQAGKVLIIAPQFLYTSTLAEVTRDRDRQCETSTMPSEKIVCPEILRWEESEADPHKDMQGFEQGHTSTAVPNIGVEISSFDVLDELIKKIVHKNAKYPNIEKVIIVGFSRGAQTVNRYSIGTRIDDFQFKKPDNTDKDVDFRYAYGAPSSHMYLDDLRWSFNGGAWSSSNSFGACPYNNYRYGTAEVEANHYMDDILRANPNATTPELKRLVFLNNVKGKKRLLLVGGLDTEGGDNNCAAEAQAQGHSENRVERTQSYFKHLWEAGAMRKQPANVGCCVVPNKDHEGPMFGGTAMTEFWKTGTFNCGPPGTGGETSQCHPLNPQ